MIPKKEQNPYNLEIGSAVRQGDPPSYGMLMWIGMLNGIEEMQAGIEMVRKKVVNCFVY